MSESEAKKYFGSDGTLFADDSKQQMLRPDMLALEVAAFLVRVKEDLLRLGCEMQLSGLRYAVTQHDPVLDLATHSVDRKRASEWQEPG